MLIEHSCLETSETFRVIKQVQFLFVIIEIAWTTFTLQSATLYNSISMSFYSPPHVLKDSNFILELAGLSSTLLYKLKRVCKVASLNNRLCEDVNEGAR